MKKQYLLDANIFISRFLAKSSAHHKSKKLLKAIDQHILTTNPLIVGEVATVLLLQTGEIELVSQIINDLFVGTQPLIRVTRWETDLQQETFNIFSQQPQDKLSFADCSLLAQATIIKKQNTKKGEGGQSPQPIIASFDQDLLIQAQKLDLACA